MSTTGPLIAVDTIPLGSPFNGDHTAGDSTLLVKRPLDFSTQGGWVLVGDDATAELLEYSTVDMVASTVVLVGTIANDHADGERVAVWDPSTAKVQSWFLCQVMPDGEDSKAPIAATPTPSMEPFVASLAGASGSLPNAVLERDGDGYVLTRLDPMPQMHGDYIDPSSAPAAQTFSVDAPTDATGFAEGHGWWQVGTDNKVVGFWRLVSGVWQPTSIVTYEALVATNALIDILQSNDFTVIHSMISQGTAEFDGPIVLRDQLTLATGVTAPAQKPTITAALQSLTPTTALSGCVGLTENSGTPGAGTAWVTAYVKNSALYLVEIDKTTGAVTEHDTTVGSSAALGVVRLGSYYYALSLSNITSTYFAWKIDGSTFALVAGGFQYSGTTPTAFGTDGTNLLFAYARSSDGKIVIRPFSTAGVAGSNIVTDVVGVSADSLWGGSADFGATRYVFTVGGSTFEVVNSSGVSQSSNVWTPVSFYVRGIYWDGTRFHSSGSSGTVTHYATQSSTVTVTATETITDGTAETAAGTASSSVSWPKRWWLKVDVPAYPATPTGLYGKVYVNTTSTRKLQTLTPALSSTNRSGYVDSLNTGSATAPTVQSGSFAAGGVGSIGDDGLKSMPKAGVKNTGTFAGTGIANVKELAVTFTKAFPTGTVVHPVVSRRISDAADMQVSIKVGSVSETGFTIRAYRVTGTGAQDIDWIAMPDTG